MDEYHAIDYGAVRAAIPLSRVLDLLGFEPTEVRGVKLRCGCLLADCGSSSPRHFSADMSLNGWYCFGCHRGGNQLDLWRALQGQSLYRSTEQLCLAANIPIPRLAPCSPLSPPRSATS